jgi:hypothetical protein
MKRLRALFLTFLLVLGGFAVITACQEKQRRPSRYLIPEGYVGWVRINFRVKDAPPIPIEDGRYLFKFPPSGLIETSSDIEYGWSKDEYFYYSGDARRKLVGTGWGESGMIWAGATGWSGNNFEERTDVREVFFVGTEEEYRKYGDEKDENYQPVIGNVRERKPKS